MMLSCAEASDGPLTPSDTIAIVGVVLTIFLIMYTLIYNRRTLRLQWFRELILEPNKKPIEEFYKDMYALDLEFNKIKAHVLTDDKRAELIQDIMNKVTDINRLFTSILVVANVRLADRVTSNWEGLGEDLAKVIYSHNIADLKEKNFYRENIEETIDRSRRQYINTIYSYRGGSGWFSKLVLRTEVFIRRLRRKRRK